MTKTKTLKWRLKDLPSSDEIGKLIELKIITKDEARQIFFSEEETPQKPKASEIDSVNAEIKLLRELVMALASRPTEIVRIVKQYEPYHWHKPYFMWANSIGVPTTTTTSLGVGGGAFNNIMSTSNRVSSGVLSAGSGATRV